MKPSFVIIPRVITPSINSGETAKIELFVSGYGEVKYQKINAIITNSSFFDMKSDNIGKVEFAILPQTMEEYEISTKDSMTGTEKLSKKHTTITEALGVFTPIDPSKDIGPVQGEINFGTEKMTEVVPPIAFYFNSKKTTPSGDYNFDFSLTYSSNGEEFFTDHKSAKIHVNTWVEQHSKFIQISTIAGAAVATFTGIYFSIFS